MYIVELVSATEREMELTQIQLVNLSIKESSLRLSLQFFLHNGMVKQRAGWTSLVNYVGVDGRHILFPFLFRPRSKLALLSAFSHSTNTQYNMAIYVQGTTSSTNREAFRSLGG